MRFRRRRSLLPRVGRRPSPEDAAPLKGQLWTRSERNLREPDVHPIRRIIAVAVATGECALLGWLWLGTLMLGAAGRISRRPPPPSTPRPASARRRAAPTARSPRGGHRHPPPLLPGWLPHR